MGTLLKILNVIILVLAIAAIVLATSLAGKREELVGRAEKLQNAVIAIGTTFETAAPTFDGVASHVAWDVDDVTERPADAPTTSDFWDDYKDEYERSATETLNLNRKKEQLSSLYKLDASGKPEKGYNGQKRTDGKGTMQEVLDETIQRAKDQYALLGRTRQQLSTVREQLDSVAGLLNEQKRLRRGNLATIAQLNAQIATYDDQLAEKDSLVAQARREKDDLGDQVTDLRSEIDRKDQDIATKDTEIARLREEIVRLSVDVGSSSGAKRGGAAAAASADGGAVALSAGVKGKVKKVEREWGFVIVELTPEAAAEIGTGADFSPVEMMVRRIAADGSESVVTRIQITNPPNARNIAVADNMFGWEQTPVQPGDEVVY